MLKIRFARAGKKKKPVFFIVVTEHTKPSKTGYQKKLGIYNPLTKDLSVESEKIKEHMKNGVQVSKSVVKVLEKNNIKL